MFSSVPGLSCDLRELKSMLPLLAHISARIGGWLAHFVIHSRCFCFSLAQAVVAAWETSSAAALTDWHLARCATFYDVWLRSFLSMLYASLCFTGLLFVASSPFQLVALHPPLTDATDTCWDCFCRLLFPVFYCVLYCSIVFTINFYCVLCSSRSSGTSSASKRVWSSDIPRAGVARHEGPVSSVHANSGAN
jgi:hypothetical protein